MSYQTIENQHTILYKTKVGYYLLMYSIYFCGRDDILYISSFYTWIFQLVYLQINSLHYYLMFITIRNNSIISKLHPNSSLLISEVSTKQPRNNRGQPIVVSKTEVLL